MEKNSRPRAMFIFGANGSGKSTLRRHLALDGIVIIDADLIAGEEKLNAFQAGKIAINRFNQCIHSWQNFLMESTLSGQSAIKRVQLAHRTNFFVQIYFVGLDNPALNKYRIWERVVKGGHHIEDAAVERRFVESISNLSKVVPFADDISLYNNSGSDKTTGFNEFLSVRNGVIIHEKSPVKMPPWAAQLMANVKICLKY